MGSSWLVLDEGVFLSLFSGDMASDDSELSFGLAALDSSVVLVLDSSVVLVLVSSVG